MKQNILLATTVALVLHLTSATSLAQQSPQIESYLDSPRLAEFNRDANTLRDALVFAAYWYVAPYPGHYYVLRLHQDGSAQTYRLAPYWALQASNTGQLSAEQVAEVKRMLASSHIRPQVPFVAPEREETHTAFVFWNGREIRRYDYVGSLPIEFQGVICFVRAEIAAQEQRNLRNRLGHPRP